MSEASDRVERKRFLKQAAPLVVALVLAVLYIISLHPWSGMLGGAFFFLFASWVIPSAINILLSYFVVSFIRVRRLWKIGLFVAVSFLLGMNTLLVPLFARPPPQPSTSDVYRPLHIKADTDVDEGLMSARIPGEVYNTYMYSPLGVHVAGNEGCMCMWMTPPVGQTTEWQVWDVINGYLGHRRSITGTTYIEPGLRSGAVGRVHFDLRFLRGKDPYTVDLLITLYDGLEPTAKFTQSGIPVWSTEPDHGHPDTISTYGFLPNAENMLWRRNFWALYFENDMSAFSKAPLKAFLRRAVVRD